MIPCGLVVRIWRSHYRGRGSIPRTGVILYVIRRRARLVLKVYDHVGFIINTPNLSTHEKIKSPSQFKITNQVHVTCKEKVNHVDLHGINFYVHYEYKI